MVRKMFHECKLVHADLSEYNILYHVEPTDVPPPVTTDDSPPAAAVSAPDEEPRGHLYIIDVSQSVEHDHPHAFDFLRSDLKNVEDFFSKRGVKCLSLRRSFEFVTMTDLVAAAPSAHLEDILDGWIHNDAQRGDEEEASGTVDEASTNHEDSVFMRSYIPRTLNEVYDPERDVGALRRGEGENLIYKDTIGIVADKENEATRESQTKVRFDVEQGDLEAQNDEASEGDEGEDEDEDEDDDENDDGSEEKEGEFTERKPRGHRHEDKEAKKVCPPPSNR